MMTDSPIPAVHSLAELSELADKALALEAANAKRDAETKAAKEELRILYEHTIPESMQDIGLASFKMTDGSELAVESVVDGSIPVANRPAAYAWLREHGHGGLIKNEVSVSLGKEQDKLADEAITALKALGLEFERSESVHASTLKSFVRETIAAGRPLPLDLLGVYVGRRAKIKRPKEAK
jgi:hypothetical protein